MRLFRPLGSRVHNRRKPPRLRLSHRDKPLDKWWLYLDAKVLRVWVLDSKARSITVFYADAAPQTYMGEELLTDSLFKGLQFTVEQVFQKAKIPFTTE